MAELKPCPFCGGEAGFPSGSLGWYWVECMNEDCPVEPSTNGHQTKEEAIEAWNRRAGDGK
jgi:hypothetical protein